MDRKHSPHTERGSGAFPHTDFLQVSHPHPPPPSQSEHLVSQTDNP